MKYKHKKSFLGYEKFKKMYEYRYDCLGSGCSATVFGKIMDPHAPVIKMGMLEYNIPYFNFLDIIVEKQDNPFYPKIHNVTIYNEAFFKIKMERLTKANTSKAQKDRLSSFSQICVSDHRNLDTRKLKDLLGDPQENMSYFLEAKNDLDVLFEKHGEDLHYDNIMLRGDQFVITDPVC